MTASRRDQLVGNRLALVGTVLYLMEWIGIALLTSSLPTDRLGHNPAATVADYADHPGRTALVAGWFSIVLLGRVVFSVGLRSAFRGMRRELALADVALVAMAVSVAIEVISFGLVSTGAWLAHAHADAGTIVALDGAGTVLFDMVHGPLGLCVVAGSLAMLQSRLFPRWLAWFGLVAGALVIVGGIVAAAAQGATGSFHDIGGPFAGVPVFGFWIWMIATSIVLFRAAPRPGAAATTAG